MLALLLLLSPVAWTVSQSPTGFAAGYYFEQGDYEQALPLWRRLLVSDPENPVVLSRVAELQLFLEGRSGIAALFENAGPRGRSANPALRRKLWELQTLFTSDKAQNLYLQGKQRFDRGDLRGALDSFHQAASADRGQVLVLQARARVEKALGLWDAFYQTLQDAQQSYAWDPALRSELAQAHLYFRDFPAAIELARQTEDPGPTLRAVAAVALADNGQGPDALPELRALAALPAAQVSPAVFASLAEITAAEGSLEESRRWQARFQARLESMPVGDWDPFRSAERKKSP